MNKKRIIFSFAIVLIALNVMILSGCKKNNDVINNETYTASFRALLDSLQPPYQTFTVSAGAESSITGSNGTLITFHPTSFKNPDGTVISSGTVNISLREVYHPGEMIANRTNTLTANNTWLMSRGQVQINATQNGQTLIAGTYSIGFKQNQESNQPMGLFYNAESSDPSAYAPVKWANNMSDSVAKVSPHSNELYYMFDSVSNFNWINCDYWTMDQNPRTDIKVILPNTFNASNCLVAVVVPSLNVAAYFTYFHNDDNSFTLSNEMPVGLSVKIVVIAAENNTNYMAVSDLTSLSDGATFNITPQSATLSQINNMLSGL